MDATFSGGAARRPFSSWRTPCREGSSSLGYFADLVVEARHESPTVYLREIGLNGRNIDPREVLSSLLLLPLRTEDSEALDRGSAFVTTQGVTLAGESLRRRQWSISRRRWCPACLAESPHHRTWWDVLPYETCHLHGCAVEDADADGLPVEWWWPNMAESPRGHRLAAASPRLPDVPVTLSSYIVGRLGFSRSIPVPLLDGAPLGDVVDFARVVGRLLGSPPTLEAPPKDAPTITEEVVTLCSGDGAGLVEAMQHWLASHSGEYRKPRGMRSFGWAALHRRALRDAQLKGLLFDTMRAALGSVGHAGKKRGAATRAIQAKNAPVPPGGIGLHDLAARLGHHHRGVANVAARIGVMPERSWYRGRLDFGPAAVEAISSAFERLLPHGEAARILRLRSADFGKIVAAGEVNPLLDVSRGRAKGGRFLREEVEALKDRMADGQAVAGLPAKRRPARPSVARLASASEAGRAGCGAVGLCTAEVEVEFGVSWETVAELERLGFLHRLPDSATKGARSLVDLESVAATAGRLASARVYHGILGATAAQVVQRLAEYGVSPVVEPRPGGRVTPMFDRVEVRRALGLERDPDGPAMDRVSELWNEFYRRLLVDCPRLKCPSRMPSDSFTIYTATRKVMFEVRADRVVGSISFMVPISKDRSSRRWEFFEFNRDEILAVSDRITWEVRLNAAEGTLVIASTDDVAKVARVFEPLTRLLGGSAGGRRPDAGIVPRPVGMGTTIHHRHPATGS